MSFLHNNPEDFAQESLTGFVLAHPDVVKAVPGGVVRATRTAQNHVAIVIGGGSGHFPAFSGLVGKGLAHGAAVIHGIEQSYLFHNNLLSSFLNSVLARCWRHLAASMISN